DHPKAKLLASVLAGYDLRETLRKIAGIQVIPRYQANAYRLELLAQLAVACCRGTKVPQWKHLTYW
ncbi:unnamed protein product, partial [Phaeothamnion confervicola]